jgi:glycosyltransferase 2 family protein
MRFGWRSAIGIVITVALLWWALRDVSPAVVIAELGRANWLLFMLATLAATVIFALRAVRWQVILQPLDKPVSFGAAWRATTIGMMVNNVLPARAGELARAYALTREERSIPLSASIASLAVDRVFDAIVLLLLGLIAIFSPALPAGATIAGRPISDWAGAGGLFVAGILIALYMIVVFPDAMLRLWDYGGRRLPPRLHNRGRGALRAFADGLAVLRSPGRFLHVLVWTVAHWLVNALAFWLGFQAVGIDAPFTAAFLVQALIAFGVAVPAAPGFFGVFEALAIVALSLYGVDRTAATSFAIGFHILSFIPVTALGAFYAARLGLRLRELQAPPAGAT